MKTLAYLECPTGIAGDMCLGALVHAGVPLRYLESELSKLGIADEFQLSAESVQRNQQVATKVHVNLLNSAPTHGHQHSHPHGHQHSHPHGHQHSHPNDHHHTHVHYGTESDQHAHDYPIPSHSYSGRRLPDIEALIHRSDISKRAADWSLAVFRLLAEAEASVHGIPPEQVHFHEVGATDAIVDIVGTCLGLDWLGIDEMVCSPLPTGGGTVRCAHGLLPVPAPAVLSMMAKARIPVYGNDIKKELVTPTGCAIAATLSASFGSPPAFTPHTIGLGAGGRNLRLPNILRLWIGTVDKAAADISSSLSAPDKQTHDRQNDNPAREEIIELQTQIDDCSPQAIAHTFSLLFTAGAVDVFSQPVAMKKNRLGTLLTVLCPAESAAICETILFRETTTLGIRRSVQHRAVLAREMKIVKTDYGEIAVKVARAQDGGAVLNMQPEYEDCAQAAQRHRVPFSRVQQAAIATASDELSGESSDELPDGLSDDPSQALP